MAAKETLHFFLISENLFTCLHQPIKKITLKLRIGLDSVPWQEVQKIIFKKKVIFLFRWFMYFDVFNLSSICPKKENLYILYSFTFLSFFGTLCMLGPGREDSHVFVPSWSHYILPLHFMELLGWNLNLNLNKIL